MTGVKRSDQDATEHDIIRVDTSHSGASTAATGEQGSAPNTSASASTSYPVAHSPSEAPTSSSSSSPTTTMRNHLREVDKGGPRVYQCLGGDKGLAEVGPVERSSGASGWNEAPLDSAHSSFSTTLPRASGY